MLFTDYYLYPFMRGIDGNQINPLFRWLTHECCSRARVDSFGSYVRRLISCVDCRRGDTRANSSSLSSSFHCAISRFLHASPLHRRLSPFPPPSPPYLYNVRLRLLGSELVRIRPNRAVSSVGRERTSATRDAASSP